MIKIINELIRDMEKNKAILLAECKYYKGEEEPMWDKLTGQFDYLFWRGEKDYVTISPKDNLDVFNDYSRFNLSTVIEINEYLCACLFTSFIAGTEQNPDKVEYLFKNKFIPIYLGSTSIKL